MAARRPLVVVNGKPQLLAAGDTLPAAALPAATDTVAGAVTVVQTTGASTTAVMSQNAVSVILGDIEAALAAINGV